MWLTIDPGETTGWSVWTGTDLVKAGQHDLWDFIDLVDEWLSDERRPPAFGGADTQRLRAVVCEDWCLYPWAAQSLIWNRQRTVRGIGALTLLGRQHTIPFLLQPAKIKEAAVAAGGEELFLTPRHENRHANDAILHGTFYLATNSMKPPTP